jgi:ATPase subunit of ABC transporter with duplicated ATPase domains
MDYPFRFFGSTPDGTAVIEGVSFSVGRERVGLVGSNGSGKSTLLRLISGQLVPRSGVVETHCRIAYLPQRLEISDSTVADVLGISEKLAAISAVERGEVNPDLFDAIGSDWNIAESANLRLGALGLGHLGFNRSVRSLSGGELTRTSTC